MQNQIAEKEADTALVNVSDMENQDCVFINNMLDPETNKQLIYSQSSFLQSQEEEDEAIKLIMELMGEDYEHMIRPAGARILVKIHQRTFLKNKKGEDTGLIAPETVKEEDKYRSAVGLVVAAGPRAYNGKRFNVGGAYCKIGDFVIFPLHAGSKVDYKGHKMRLIFDDNVEGVTKDPSHISFDY